VFLFSFSSVEVCLTLIESLFSVEQSLVEALNLQTPFPHLLFKLELTFVCLALGFELGVLEEDFGVVIRLFENIVSGLSYPREPSAPEYDIQAVPHGNPSHCADDDGERF